MHTAKCELCEVEVEFRTYQDDSGGWIVMGGAWWCPKCQEFIGHITLLRAWVKMLPRGLREGILAHLPGLAVLE